MLVFPKGNHSTTVDAVTRDRKSCFQKRHSHDNNHLSPSHIRHLQPSKRNPHRQLNVPPIKHPTLCAAVPPPDHHHHFRPRLSNTSDCANRTAQSGTLPPEFTQKSFMHPGSSETPVSVPRDPNLISSDLFAQHGSPRSQPSSPNDASPRESIFGGDAASGSDDGHHFDQDFGRLRATDYASVAQPVMTAGQRIAEYENALMLSRQHVPHTLAFQVVKNSSNSPGRVKLTDFPNGTYIWVA